MADKTEIDLDALEDPNFYLKLDGKSHPLEALTVEGFIANTKAMQELDVSRGLEGEIDMMVRMLGRSFPTIGADRFRKIPMAKLYYLIDEVQKRNGARTGGVD